MHRVPIFVESRYKVNRRKIKEKVQHVLSENGIVTPTEVSIAIIGDRKMRELNKKYRHIDKTTNVLSFPQTEGEAMASPPGMIYLGDIVISYPQVIEEASAEKMFVDDKIIQLVEHGLLHLIGQHHA